MSVVKLVRYNYCQAMEQSQNCLSIWEERVIYLLVNGRSFQSIIKDVDVEKYVFEDFFKNKVFLSRLQSEAKKRGFKWETGGLVPID